MQFNPLVDPTEKANNNGSEEQCAPYGKHEPSRIGHRSRPIIWCCSTVSIMNFKAILDSLPISRTLELFLHQDDIALLAVALKYEWPSTSLLFQDILMWIPSRSASLAMAALSSFSYINDLDIPLAYTPYYQTPADGWDSLIQISKEYIYLKYICNEIGFGIFARKTIPRGKVVVPYLGELISTRQREKRFQNEYDQKVKIKSLKIFMLCTNKNV